MKEKPTIRKRAIKGKEPMPDERNEEPVLSNERPHLYTVALAFQTIQRARVSVQLSCQSRPEHAPIKIREGLIQLEKDIVKYMSGEAATYSVWPWLSGIKGIGPRIGGMLLGLIDIRKANNPSSLWRYAGMAVVPWCPACKHQVVQIPHNPTVLKCDKCGSPELNYIAERRVKGQKLHYNDRLKKTCFLIARQFLMANTEPYVSVYRATKETYSKRHPDWPDGRVDLTARRKMVKIFLVHLWVEWREAEGLPTRSPYVEGQLGYKDMILSRK